MGISAIEKSATIAIMSKDSWGEGNVFLRGKTYHVQYSVNGKRRRESAKTGDERKAIKFLREKLTAAQGGALPTGKVTVSVLLDNLLDFYRTNRPRSADWAAIVVKHLRSKDHCPALNYMKAEMVGTAQIKEYIKARKALGRDNGTINRELALLRRAFSLGKLHEPPLVNRVPRIEELPENPPRSGFFEAEPFARLCAELLPDVADVALFAFWTGCRKSEILRLRWPQIDLGEAMIRLDRTKNGEDRDVPMSDPLFEMLSRRRAQRDAKWKASPWVFSREGERIVNFYTSWKSACVRAGLGDEASLLHDLRRTGVRNLIRAGVSRKVAMLISGHKTEAVFERYHIVELDDVRDAMKRLQDHLKGKK